MRKLDGGQIDDPGEGVPSREGPRVRGLTAGGNRIPVPLAIGRSAPRKSLENSSAVRVGTARDTVSLQPGSKVSKPMPEGEIAKAVQLLDLMLEFFADDGHWTRGRYDDGNGGHCVVGAVLHLSRKHCLPKAPAIALLQDAMPRPGLPLVHFNDRCCGSAAEIILKARRLADDHAELAQRLASSATSRPG